MKIQWLLGACVAVVSGTMAARANVTPNPLFSDHMVLQQGKAIPVWGTADAGEQVTVTLGAAKQAVAAGPDGKWMVKLPEQKGMGMDAEGVEMVIAGKNTVTIKDVLIGEVWLGSGQSNMQFPVSKAKASYAGLLNEEQEIAAANYPKIRMFTVAGAQTFEPQMTVKGDWKVCSPATVPDFSALGYLFARDLQRELKVPVGVLLSAVGASTADAWVSREAFIADPVLKPTLEQFDASVAFFKTNPTATYGAAPPRPTPINKPRPAPTGRAGDPLRDQHEPTVLFNGMINPLVPYAIKGAIWYQGESIIGGAKGLANYGRLQNTVIADWRKRWGEDFPFYIVQLPGQQNISNNPVIREQQAEVYKLPNTGMAVIMDTGEAKNVHPHNKAPLGERLTKIALANAYGKKVEYSGPVYDLMKVEGGAVRVKFTHLGAPDHDAKLVAKGGPLKWFQVAGEDQKFVDAVAVIDGDCVVVSSPAVAKPVAVRYAWDNYPDGCNLFNGADLPASPFRTDKWEYPIVGLVE